MTDDAPKVIVWEWNPVQKDSLDVLLTPNDITGEKLNESPNLSDMETNHPKSKT
jgi:hypothetical protein